MAQSRHLKPRRDGQRRVILRPALHLPVEPWVMANALHQTFPSPRAPVRSKREHNPPPAPAGAVPEHYPALPARSPSDADSIKPSHPLRPRERHSDSAHENVVIDPVKEFADVHVQHPSFATPDRGRRAAAPSRRPATLPTPHCAIRPPGNSVTVAPRARFRRRLRIGGWQGLSGRSLKAKPPG